MENNLIVSLLCAADNKIIGRIRIQKIVFLLDQLGLNSDFDFSYHHYGPYSEDLSQELLFNRVFDESIIETFEKTSFGAEYSVYTPKVIQTDRPTHVGSLDFDFVKKSVASMKATTSVVIELAATIHWLRVQENVNDWEAELKKRKASKATPQNIEKAEILLAEINL